MFPQLVIVLGLISLARGFSITPFVADGIPDSRNISIEPFQKIGNGYYYIERSELVNWYAAYESCRKINAELVSFETKEEMDALAEKISDSFIAYWTSGNDHAVNGNHTWFSTAQPILSDLWFYTEPNDMNGIERCVVLIYKVPSNHGTALHDVHCMTRKSRYICEARHPKTASFIVH